MAGGIEEEEGRTNQSFLTRDQHGVPRGSTQVRKHLDGFIPLWTATKLSLEPDLHILLKLTSEVAP